MDRPVVLHRFPGSGPVLSLSPPCLKVEMALRLLRLPYRAVDHRRPGTIGPVSPTGRLPVAEIGDRRVADSVAILDALEEHAASVPWPTAGAEQARDRLHEHFATDTLYWLGFFARWHVPANARRLLEAVTGRGHPLRRRLVEWIVVPRLRRRGRAQGTGLRGEEDVHAAFARALSLLEATLEGGPFLAGRDGPGRGDLAVAAHLAQVGFAGTLPREQAELRRRPGLMRHASATFEACGLPAPEGLFTALEGGPP